MMRGTVAPMKLVLATPLYPPDIAEPAPYVKELAKRLALTHEVTIVTYGRLPEKVPGVRIVAIDKRQPLFARLFKYTFALAHEARRADLVYAQNGAATELPVGIVTRLTRTPLVLHYADTAAHAHAAQSRLYGAIERFAARAARGVTDDMPLPRPEILPLKPKPEAAFAEYETSWAAHLAEVTSLLNHA
jgi:hypothetical protein